MLRSDRGGEYESPFVDVCAQHRIIHETTTPYSPQSNGVVERKNHTLKEMMNAMLISYGLPQNMWGEVMVYHKIKQRRLYMSYGEDNGHPINTCKCGDVWPKWQFLHLKM